MLLSIIEIIKQSWQIYKNNWRHFLGYSFMLFFPTFILTLMSIIGVSLTLYLPVTAVVNTIIILLVVAANVVFAVWVSTALTKTIGAAVQKQSLPSYITELKTTNRLIWPVIYTSLLVTAATFGVPTILIVIGAAASLWYAVFLGLLLAFIPGIILVVWYIFASYEVILCGVKGLAAMKASKNLVTGRWWSIVWRVSLPMLFFSIMSAFISYLLASPFEYAQSSIVIFNFADEFIASLVNCAISPLVIAAAVILYFNVKSRASISKKDSAT